MWTWLRIVAWATGITGAVLLVLYCFVFDVWRVPVDDPLLAASVEPTLNAGDVILVTRHSSVGRGNLLRCADPQAPGRFVVARAVATSGETLEVQNEVMTLDAHRTPSPRACDAPTHTVYDPQTGTEAELYCAIEDFGQASFSVLRSREHPVPPTKVNVEPGRWYLLSDDRHVHLDSRDYGAIDPATCEHIVFRLVGAAGVRDRDARMSVIW